MKKINVTLYCNYFLEREFFCSLARTFVILSLYSKYKTVLSSSELRDCCGSCLDACVEEILLILFMLTYISKKVKHKIQKPDLVGNRGFEPLTSSTSMKRSSQMS